MCCCCAWAGPGVVLLCCLIWQLLGQQRVQVSILVVRQYARPCSVSRACTCLLLQLLRL